MPGIGQASAEGSRPLPTDGVHGCFVGNGLDRSGDVCRCCMVKYCCGVGAAYMRPGSVRQTGAYGKPAGRACPAPTARQPKSVHQRSHPGRLSSQPAFPSHLHLKLPFFLLRAVLHLSRRTVAADRDPHNVLQTPVMLIAPGRGGDPLLSH